MKEQFQRNDGLGSQIVQEAEDSSVRGIGNKLKRNKSFTGFRQKRKMKNWPVIQPNIWIEVGVLRVGNIIAGHHITLYRQLRVKELPQVLRDV